MTSGVIPTDQEYENTKARVLDYFARTPGGTFAAACKSVGLSHSTAYDWRKADPAFDAAVVTARKLADDIGGDFAEGKLMEAINNNELTGIIFYLKTKHKHRGYVERTEQAAVKPTPTTDEDEALLGEYAKAD